MKVFILAFTLLALVSCGDDNEGSQAGALAGPGVSIHCNGLTPQPSLGDTSVRVACAPEP